MSKPSTIDLRNLAEKIPAEDLKAVFLEAMDEIQDYEADTLLRNIAHRAADKVLDRYKQEKG